jgi:hypothetical protein
VLIVLLVVLPMLSPSLNIVARLVVPPVKALIGFYLTLVGLADKEGRWPSSISTTRR